MCEEDPQAYLLGSAPSEVGAQDTQMQWLSIVFSLMLTCRAWFWGLRGSSAGWRPFPLQQETCGSLRQREGWMDIQDCFTLNPLSAQHSWTLEMANAQR